MISAAALEQLKHEHRCDEPATSPESAADPIARAVAKVREQFGDDADVACLLAAAVGKVPRKKGRGGISARRAAQNALRNERLRTLRARLWPALQPPAAAALIAEKFRRYETSRWLRLRECDEVVAPLDEPQRTFWMILDDQAKGGAKMPGVSRDGRSSKRDQLRQLATILGG